MNSFDEQVCKLSTRSRTVTPVSMLGSAFPGVGTSRNSVEPLTLGLGCLYTVIRKPGYLCDATLVHCLVPHIA